MGIVFEQNNVGCKANISHHLVPSDNESNQHVFLLITLILLSCFDSKTQTPDIKPFEAIILNSDNSMAYSILTILTNNELKIVFKNDLVGEKDSVLFSKSLQLSDTLQQIQKNDIDQLINY